MYGLKKHSGLLLCFFCNDKVSMFESFKHIVVLNLFDDSPDVDYSMLRRPAMSAVSEQPGNDDDDGTDSAAGGYFTAADLVIAILILAHSLAMVVVTTSS